MEKRYGMSADPLVRFLDKERKYFSKEDIIYFIDAHEIQMVNLRYAGGDGRLKTLNFVINNREHLENILCGGERVDGSSLFKNIGAGSSDLYVVPRFRTAFLNPFSESPSIDILCSYFDKDGNLLAKAPENILAKAHKVLKERTGLSFQVMGELEYYVISEKEDIFPSDDQKGYHESYPFNKWENFRTDAMLAIAQCGGNIKYAHSEVGNFTLGDYNYEQNEIEFRPDDLEEAADQLMIAKWILRTLAYEYGVSLTFAPKITVGKAGSGMHVHTRLIKEGRNAMITKNGLSDIAKKAIAGYLDLAPSLSAFGNTNPTSYFRLVPHQEAPTNICWGDRNRSVLVRVPLGWTGKTNMTKIANPKESGEFRDLSERQTVEFRCPDGSANIYLLLAGLTVAARHGIEMENALQLAEDTYVDVDIFKEEHKEKQEKLKQLPTSCWESADKLREQADIYKKYDVFPEDLIEGTIKMLKAYKDQNIREEVHCDKEKILKLVDQFMHCG